jgi:leucyl-tRNA synthetase
MTTSPLVRERLEANGWSFGEAEPHWQASWESSALFHSEPSRDKPNWSIMELPPFANGTLHLGHVRNYVIGDVSARFRRMAGYNVLYTSGFDSFGLPNELAAREARRHPKELAERVMAGMRKQFVRLGLSHDTRRIIGYHDEQYYRWVQWVFLVLFQHGFVYRKRVPVNFCPQCQITLADSLALGGRCWRCSTAVEARSVEQWLVRESDFAEELLSGLESLNGWPAKIKRIHEDWIGKQTGVDVRFDLQEAPAVSILAFVAFPALLPGASFCTISPDHPLIETLNESNLLSREVRDRLSVRQADFTASNSNREAVHRILPLGVHVINPVTAVRIPVAISFDLDQRQHQGVRVLFPAHVRGDARLCEALGLSLIPVMTAPQGTGDPFEWEDDWIYTNAAGELKGETVSEGCRKIIEKLTARGSGSVVTRYRLRDWNIARQRYWGPPVPIVHCALCGPVAVPHEDLPVRLPMDVDLDTYENPLRTHPGFLNAPCPTCGRNATRDTDTLEAYSSPWWYHWNCKGTSTDNPFDLEESRLYTPINLMIGGEDQARTCFFHVRMMARALKRAGVVEYVEPIDTLLALGMVKSGGHKMSKSEGNVVDPDALIQKYGADALRFGVLSASAPQNDMNWSDSVVRLASNFLANVWGFFERNVPQIQFADFANVQIDPTYSLTRKLARHVETAVARTTESLRQNNYHLAASNLMQLFARLEQYEVEALKRREKLDTRDCAALSVAGCVFLRLLTPLCPHITEEIWARGVGAGMIAEAEWPMTILRYEK